MPAAAALGKYSVNTPPEMSVGLGEADQKPLLLLLLLLRNAVRCISSKISGPDGIFARSRQQQQRKQATSPAEGRMRRAELWSRSVIVPTRTVAAHT